MSAREMLERSVKVVTERISLFSVLCKYPCDKLQHEGRQRDLFPLPQLDKPFAYFGGADSEAALILGLTNNAVTGLNALYGAAPAGQTCNKPIVAKKKVQQTCWAKSARMLKR